MNERFQQLLKQSTNPPWDGEQGPMNEFNPEEFAELIVDQMLAITDAHTEVFQTNRDRAVIEHIKQSVKQHFGVKG